MAAEDPPVPEESACPSRVQAREVGGIWGSVLPPHGCWSWVSDGLCDDGVLKRKLCAEPWSQVWPHNRDLLCSPVLHIASNQVDFLT